MQKNVGGIDRTIRLAVGGLLILFGVLGYLGRLRVATGISPQALTSILIAGIGLVLIVTAVVCRCPINSLLDRDTTTNADSTHTA